MYPQYEGWLSARRYAVPAWMSDLVAQRGSVGDWHGACAAANIDVAFTLADIAREHGRAVAEAVEDDLRNLLPDLLRWHLPRTMWSWGQVNAWIPVRLATYQPGNASDGRMASIGSRISAKLRPAPAQPLDLFVGSLDPVARRHDRVALQFGDLTMVFPARTGAATTFIQRRPWTGPPPVELSRAMWDARCTDQLCLDCPGSHPGSEPVPCPHRPAKPAPVRPWEYLPPGAIDGCALPDRVLLAKGTITPRQLHPAVRHAWFPQLEPGPRQSTPVTVPGPIRVRCQTHWHLVGMVDGQLRLLDHADPEQEARREAVIAALGGQASACFRVATAWRTGRGRLPKALRQWRSQLLQLALHGDNVTIKALMDAGADVTTRWGDGRTLMHHLVWLDDTELLDRLVAAGLDPSEPDLSGQTPYEIARRHCGSAALLRALRR